MVRKIVQSEGLLAINRLLVALVSVIGFPLLIWLATTVLNVDRRQAVLEADNTRKTADILALQRGRESDLASLGLLGRELGKLGEKIDSQRSSLNRIEAFIDRQPSRP